MTFAKKIWRTLYLSLENNENVLNSTWKAFEYNTFHSKSTKTWCIACWWCLADFNFLDISKNTMMNLIYIYKNKIGKKYIVLLLLLSLNFINWMNKPRLV